MKEIYEKVTFASYLINTYLIYSFRFQIIIKSVTMTKHLDKNSINGKYTIDSQLKLFQLF